MTIGVCAMPVCRICGNEFRAGEDAIVVGDDQVHPNCAGAPTKAAGKRFGMWLSMGRHNQMAMGDVQREP
jgi:hypothetical protein